MRLKDLDCRVSELRSRAYVSAEGKIRNILIGYYRQKSIRYMYVINVPKIECVCIRGRKDTEHSDWLIAI